MNHMTPPTAIPAGAQHFRAISRVEQEPFGGVLTPRQFEVVRRFALGQTWDTIARDLRLSKATVSRYRYDALDRTNSATLHELWMKLGWLNVPSEAA